MHALLHRTAVASLIALASLTGPASPAFAAETTCSITTEGARDALDDGLICDVASCTSDFVDSTDVDGYVECLRDIL